METKTVVQGGHGPVPTEENTTRYVDAEPVVVPMSTYYLRRMMSGELVEYVAPAEPVQPVAQVAASPAHALSFDHSEKEGA